MFNLEKAIIREQLGKETQTKYLDYIKSELAPVTLSSSAMRYKPPTWRRMMTMDRHCLIVTLLR